MDEFNAWKNFESSGKISDYLAYKQYNSNSTANKSEAFFHANQNKGDYFKTTQHW